LPHGVIDIVSAFAPALLDETWTPVPFARLVVPVACRDMHWCMAHYGEATHFMAAVPTAIRLVEGCSAIAEGARKGYHILTTVADGNCGPDALLAVASMDRNTPSLLGLRLQIRTMLYHNAVSPVWHEIASACQELSAAPVARPAVTRPSAAEPAVAVPSAAEPAAAGPSAAEPAAAGPSAAEHAAARPSAAKLAVAKPLAAEPVVPGPSAAESAAAGLSSAGPQSCGDLGIVPAGLPPDLEQALRWSTGLPNPTLAVVRRLAGILTDEQATDLVKAHRSSIEAAPRPACNKRTGHGIASRAHTSRLMHVRLADAKDFADWAAANGTDHRQPESVSRCGSI
jgi:hypothetical protein